MKSGFCIEGPELTDKEMRSEVQKEVCMLASKTRLNNDLPTTNSDVINSILAMNIIFFSKDDPFLQTLVDSITKVEARKLLKICRQKCQRGKRGGIKAFKKESLDLKSCHFSWHVALTFRLDDLNATKELETATDNHTEINQVLLELERTIRTLRKRI